MSVREIIDRAPTSRFQVVVVAVCVVLCLVDGFDILAMSFAASGVAREWQLSGTELGLLLSSGLAGMAVGSALIAPLADRIGRRRLMLACLAVSTVGMGLAALSGGVVALGLCRLLTGLGIGGLVAALPVIISEFVPARRRGTTVAIYGSGLPTGGVLGGLVATAVVGHLGWRAIFAVGTALTLALLLVAAAAVPESIDYLIVRRPDGALERVNAVLGRMNHPALAALPEPPAQRAGEVRTALLGGGAARRTVLLWVAFFISMGSYYFAASWTPRFIEQSGATAQQGINGGLLLSLGGVGGCLLLGLLAVRAHMHLLTAGAFVGVALTFVALMSAVGDLGLTLVLAVAIGLFGNACAAGLFAMAPGLYPAQVRGTAVGWAAAAGRIGAIVSPSLVGILLDRAWTPAALFGLFALPLLLAAVVSWGLRTPDRTPAAVAPPALRMSDEPAA